MKGGLGKGGKFSSKGGKAFRGKHSAFQQQDVWKGITDAAIRKLHRRGGCRRMNGEMYEEARNLIKAYMEKFMQDAITYTDHSGRHTIAVMDVVYALKRDGKQFYYCQSGKSKASGGKAKAPAMLGTA